MQYNSGDIFGFNRRRVVSGDGQGRMTRILAAPLVALAALALIGCGTTVFSMPPSRPSSPAAGAMLLETPPGISVFEGGTLTKIDQPSGTWSNTPSWAPGGGITFVSDRGGAGRQVWFRDALGTHTRLTNFPSTIQAERPQQGRNGTIVFAAITPETILLPDMHHPSNMTIYAMDADGSGLRTLAFGMFPAIAPSGTWLVYTHQVDEPYRRQLWRINIDGTDNRQLTFPEWPDYPDANAASISPDGLRIAFFSGKEQDIAFEHQPLFTFGFRNIAIISANGGARRHITPCKPVTTMDELRLTKNCLVADQPAWADNHKLIFDYMHKAANDQVISETWVVKDDGTGLALFYPGLRVGAPISIRRKE